MDERPHPRDHVCERCEHAIQRVHWFAQTWDAAGRPAGGRALESGFRCGRTRQLVLATEWCEHFQYWVTSSRHVEAF